MPARLRQRLLRWLLKDVDLAALTGPKIVGGCRLDPTAVLTHEAVVENFHGGEQNVTVGAHTHCRNRFITYGHGGRITVGDWTYIGLGSEIWSMDSVSIGNRVLISHGVNIHDGTAHSLDAGERHAHYRHILERGHPTTWEDMPGVSAAPVVIEDDVWISFGVSILKGVRIGKGSVVAANAIVKTDVPPDSLYRCKVEPIVTPLS